ncbi:MAG: Twin-arginine translocation pathway signal [Gammaproteobacteria bacterium RBG_16_57_12]|nr:MAG: Twin-arginine translocation pathway signal [Gammaproteobacteria bacterium RBG_16_57_12]
MLLTRRKFLKLGLMLTGAGMLPAPVLARARLAQAERMLAFYNTHTGETLRTVYWAQGRYHAEALREVNHILRDHRTNEIIPIEPQLLDLLHALHDSLGSQRPFEIISGYRSPASNGMLAAGSDGVAKGSLHMLGKAVDIRLPGRALHDLRQAAVALRVGGVGYYPQLNFVHLDTGPVRYW